MTQPPPKRPSHRHAVPASCHLVPVKTVPGLSTNQSGLFSSEATSNCKFAGPCENALEIHDEDSTLTIKQVTMTRLVQWL